MTDCPCNETWVLETNRQTNTLSPAQFSRIFLLIFHLWAKQWLTDNYPKGYTCFLHGGICHFLNISVYIDLDFTYLMTRGARLHKRSEKIPIWGKIIVKVGRWGYERQVSSILLLYFWPKAESTTKILKTQIKINPNIFVLKECLLYRSKRQYFCSERLCFYHGVLFLKVFSGINERHLL